MKYLVLFLLSALVRLCYGKSGLAFMAKSLSGIVFPLISDIANVHGVICRQKRFELPPNLQDCNIISGGLIVDGYAGVFSLPNLRMVDSISFQSGNITEISLPNLVAVTQFLTFWDLPQLDKTDLPSLVSGRPSILLTWLPKLTSFNMANLVTSSSIKIKSTPSLKELSLPNLARIKEGNFSGSFQIEDGPRHLSLPELVEVGGPFNVTGRVDTCVDFSELRP
jgi:hypothetical protein